MAMSSAAPVRDVVLVGGGHAHVHVLRQLAMHPLRGARVTLVTRDVHTPYSGMLPGLIAGHYSWLDCHIDLRRLCALAGASLVYSPATSLKPDHQLLCLNDGRPPLPFDLLSIDVGISPHFTPDSGVQRHATPVKPIDSFDSRWHSILHRARSSSSALTVTVVGGGAGGLELALSIKHRLNSASAHGSHVRVVTSGLLLQTCSRAARRRFLPVLKAKGIELVENARVYSIAAGKLYIESQKAASNDNVGSNTRQSLDTDECIWCTQASPQQWLSDCGLTVDSKGFIRVHETLESVSHRNIFAAGDAAVIDNHPRPRAGVFAVRQGPPLERNIRKRLLNRRLERHIPQSRYLALVSTGCQHAIALYGSVSFGGLGPIGKLLWKQKDRIDKKFMSMYQDLPDVESMMTSRMQGRDAENPVALAQGGDALEAMKSQAMRCGGCGSKVGHSVLSRVLSRLDIPGNACIVDGIGDDAALLHMPADKKAVQTIDYVRDFVGDPYIFGRIAAVHALGDVWAMGAQPQAALVVATVPYATETLMERTLESLLAGACVALRESNCSLAGGHTSESREELCIGFSVHGVIDPDKALRKSGMRNGQALILTKPVGSGVLFAADMRANAKGMWVTAAITHMQQESASAAEVLVLHGASAATDVTGFGIVGHLLEMCKASNACARVELDALPAYDGAVELLRRGFASSLHESNVRLRRAVSSSNEATTHPAYPLAFDPQTAGGLLASVPADRADECVSALQENGYTKAVKIGRVESSQPGKQTHSGADALCDDPGHLITLVGNEELLPLSEDNCE